MIKRLVWFEFKLTKGIFGLSVTFLLFLYYTIWTLFVIVSQKEIFIFFQKPFLRSDHFLWTFFPQKKYAFMIVSFFISLLISFSFCFSGILILKK
jgi:hypothetical protein